MKIVILAFDTVAAKPFNPKTNATRIKQLERLLRTQPKSPHTSKRRSELKQRVKLQERHAKTKQANSPANKFKPPAKPANGTLIRQQSGWLNRRKEALRQKIDDLFDQRDALDRLEYPSRSDHLRSLKIERELEKLHQELERLP